MKIIIAGSRTFNDHDFIVGCLEKTEFDITEIVSGCAKGVDTVAIQIGEVLDIPVAKFPADWETYGRRAGPVRNSEMGKYADGGIVIWDGKSKGSANMISCLKKLGKPCEEHIYDI